jgi:hypothetical protein
MRQGWAARAAEFLRGIHDLESGGSSSVSAGPVTLYGTCYAELARAYLSPADTPSDRTREFILNCQNPKTGLMVGPELRGYCPPEGAAHDREHLALHLTCTALGTCQHFNISVPHPVYDAHRFCDQTYLSAWLDRRDLRNAWLEGNNLLFVGQLLVYLRDIEHRQDAQPALDAWFRWLDSKIDGATNLWGTNGFCDAKAAVYGGYHQLLVYYHEDRPLVNLPGLVDTVLGLQHHDGGFDPDGNAGACEDVDSVDILVNTYKRGEYRHAEVRNAIRRCAAHILRTQNDDGGFPYRLNITQGHMGVPGTAAPPNASTTFATWFRIHTLALCAEVVPEYPPLGRVLPGFSRTLSMGWHESPASWSLQVSGTQTFREFTLAPAGYLKRSSLRLRGVGRRIARRLGWSK